MKRKKMRAMGHGHSYKDEDMNTFPWLYLKL